MKNIQEWRAYAKYISDAYQDARINNVRTHNDRGHDDGVQRYSALSDNTRFATALEEIFGTENNYSLTIRQLYLNLHSIGYTEGSYAEQLERMQKNRMQVIALMAYTEALYLESQNVERFGGNAVYAITSINPNALQISIAFESYVEGQVIEEHPIANHATMKFLEAMQDVVITKEHLVKAVNAYNNRIRELNRYISASNSRNKDTGLEKLFQEAPRPTETLVMQQLTQLESKIGNGLTARTYGFEIEVPDCKGVKAPNGFEKGDDGSLRSYQNDNDDCDCDCDDCTYHDCDCDWCDNRNPEPDHCSGSSCSGAESAEYRTVGGVQRMKHSGMYQLCKELNEEDAEMNDSAGTHIHVFAADLETKQVGQVLATYKWLENILSAIAGRRGTSYAMEVPVNYVASAIKKNNAYLTKDKPRAVNVTPLFTSRGTIEFRQMDCNLNADRITAWAWLVRGLVTAAKRGAELKDYKQVTDLSDIVSVFAKFNIEPDNEHPELIIYGSKSDDEKIKRVVHKDASSR